MRGAQQKTTAHSRCALRGNTGQEVLGRGRGRDVRDTRGGGASQTTRRQWRIGGQAGWIVRDLL